MNEPEAVIPLDAGPQPNMFFQRSPFRSWQFIVNTVLGVLDCIGIAFILSRRPNSGYLLVFVPFLLAAVISPYRWALVHHRRIRKLFRSGELAQQPAGTPQSILLEITERTLNDGLFNTSIVFGGLLLGFILWKLH
jgi:hypothetical protein